MKPTIESIVDSIIDRELHPSERGKPWSQVIARSHKSDRGGLTRAGITATTLGQWRQLGRQATRAELEAMPEDECREIYRARYVRPFEFVVPDPLRSLLVDWAVTSGHDDPTRALQTALRGRGVYKGAIDGVCGAQTRRAALNDPDPRATYNDVLIARARFYIRLGLSDPDVVHFLNTHPESQLHNVAGLVNRTLEFVL